MITALMPLSLFVLIVYSLLVLLVVSAPQLRRQKQDTEKNRLMAVRLITLSLSLTHSVTVTQ